MEISAQDIMFYFYILIGILIQFALLFAYPVYRIVKDRTCIIGWWFLITNMVWSLYVYYDIWLVFNHPDEWSLNTPGFVLGGYALFGPLIIWFVHSPIYILSVFGLWALNKARQNRPAGWTR
ncbi:MAG: hypothetical protein ACW7DS_17785 [Paraglaciecola chathamensis]